MRIVSNNTNKRVAPLAKKLGLPFTANGCKPLTFGISKAIKIMGVPKNRWLSWAIRYSLMLSQGISRCGVGAC